MAELKFTTSIKPLFREKDRNSMLEKFDLWSVADVRDNAQAILEVLRSGRMPCDGSWSRENVDLFALWVAGGMPE